MYFSLMIKKKKKKNSVNLIFYPSADLVLSEPNPAVIAPPSGWKLYCMIMLSYNGM